MIIKSYRLVIIRNTQMKVTLLSTLTDTFLGYFYGTLFKHHELKYILELKYVLETLEINFATSPSGWLHHHGDLNEQ